MRKIISTLLVLAMLLGMTTGITAAYAHTYQFNNGNITYDIKEDGSTTFTGRGDILTSDLPTNWSSTAGDITTLVIGEGITRIAKGTSLFGPFRGIDNLTSVTLPSTLQAIEDSSFSFCSDLETVTIAHGPTTIEDDAFYYCTSLTTINIPSSVTAIGGDAFASCRSLTTITYDGTQEMWDAITFTEDSSWREKVTIVCNDAATCEHEVTALENAKSPTVSDTGYSGDLICQNCRKTLTTGETLPIITMPFTDIDKNAYYYHAVAWAFSTEVTKGMSEATFAPNNQCTRGQVVTFLWRAAGSPAPTSTKNPFTDVPAGMYYTTAVLWAVEKGITKGTSDTTFSPDNTVTRGQFVTFLYRAADPMAEDPMDNHPFSDVTNSEQFFYDAVIWASRHGYTSGTGNGKFSPNNPCTRGQTVTFLHRYYENAPLTEASAVALNRYQIVLGDVYKINHTLTATVMPDTASETPVTWSSSDTSVATVDANGKVKIQGYGNAIITATAGNAKTQCTVSTFSQDCSSYVGSDYRYLMRNHSITNITDVRGGTYINLDGQRCVITMFWVRGYNALGGLVTECYQTLHILDTGETIRRPDKYYDDLADRAFGAMKLYYTDLQIDYLGLQTDYKLFPSYTVDSNGIAYRN